MTGSAFLTEAGFIHMLVLSRTRSQFCSVALKGRDLCLRQKSGIKIRRGMFTFSRLLSLSG